MGGCLLAIGDLEAVYSTTNQNSTVKGTAMGAVSDELIVTRDLIAFNASDRKNVVLKLFDLNGMEVATLFEGIPHGGVNFVPISHVSSRLPPGEFLIFLDRGDHNHVVPFVSTES